MKAKRRGLKEGLRRKGRDGGTRSREEIKKKSDGMKGGEDTQRR